MGLFLGNAGRLLGELQRAMLRVFPGSAFLAARRARNLACLLPEVLPGSYRIERRNVEGRRYLSNKSGAGDFASMLKNMKDAGAKKDLDEEVAPKKSEAAVSGLGNEKAEKDIPVEPAASTKGASAAENDTEANSDKPSDESTDEDKAKTETEAPPTESTADRLRKQMSSFDWSNFAQSIPSRSRLLLENFVEGTKLAWDELVNPKKVSALERKVHQAESYKKAPKVGGEEDEDEDEDGEEKEPEPVKDKGPSAIVHVKDEGSQWDAMRARLADSPIIREIFKRSKGAYKQAVSTDAGAAAAAAAENMKNKVYDAREFWETSQNPLVYTLSGVWDNVTGDTEESLVVKEILKLDPQFMKEEWLEEVRTELVPKTITSHLSGDIEYLRAHCGEACFAKLSNDIKTRAADKVTFESKMVDLDENFASLKFLESGAPVIVCMYMVQQINVIRKDGEIIDGDEKQVVARFYSMAFQQEYDEVDEVVRWRITDYEYGGDMKYY